MGNCCDECREKTKGSSSSGNCGCPSNDPIYNKKSKCCPNRCGTVVGLDKLGPDQAAPLIVPTPLTFYLNPLDGNFPGYSNMYQCNCLGVNMLTPDDNEYISIPCPGTYLIGIDILYASDVVFGTAFLSVIPEINGELQSRVIAVGTPLLVNGSFIVSFNQPNNLLRIFTLSTQIGLMSPEISILRVTEPIGTEICYESLHATSAFRFLY